MQMYRIKLHTYVDERRFPTVRSAIEEGRAMLAGCLYGLGYRPRVLILDARREIVAEVEDAVLPATS